MDMVTISVGQVALRSSCLVAQTPRLTIEDITNLPKEKADNCLWAEGL